ncbi:hypothetical protein Tco_1359644 [Tanacetum coccineum]
MGEGSVIPTDPHYTPTFIQPSPQPQKTQKPKKPKRKDNQTAQANEIASLKRRVKKLEQKKRSRTHGLKRLRKVGATARVESSGDEESLGKDASKQGRINTINADDDITLVSVQDDADKEMFDVDALNGEEVFIARQNENVVEEDKGKGIMIEELVKTIKKKDPISFDKEVALKLQAKIDADHQLAERLQAQEQESLSVEERVTLFQQLLEKRRKHFAATRVNTFEDFRIELVEGKEKRAGTELAQEITMKQKIYMLVEKKSPLIPSTLTMMLEKKLQIDYESEVDYQLLKFIVKQLKKKYLEASSWC